MIISICKTIMVIMITIVVVLVCAEIICQFFGFHLENLIDDIDNFIYEHFHNED